MTAGKLLLASVTVIDEDKKSAPILKNVGDAVHPSERSQGRFDALTLLGMNAVAVEKLDFSGGRSDEGFDDASALEADA